MDFQILGAIIFFIILLIFLILKKDRFQLLGKFPFAYIALYKTKIGLNFMDRFAKRHSKILQALAWPIIVLGFLAMIFISCSLIWSFLLLFLKPQAPAAVGVVLPIPIKGVVYVPFFYWIISIFILSIVHESAHGIIARTYNMKLKSSGFAFIGLLFPVIPAAFVEPDEKEILKRPLKQRLAMFSAGSISNILVGLLVMLILTLLVSSMTDFQGVRVTNFTQPGLAAEKAGMIPGQVITEIDGKSITKFDEFGKVLEQKKPGDTISVKANESTYSVVLGTNPGNAKKPYLGVYVEQASELKFDAEKNKIPLKILLCFLELLFWLFLLNIGIGLFNLLPILPLDGGRMLKDTLDNFMKKERVNAIIVYLNIFFAAIISISIVASFLKP